jgi:hypothetical protein
MEQFALRGCRLLGVYISFGLLSVFAFAFLHTVIADDADTIEHAPLDDASIALMKQHGTAYTPTLLAGKLIDYRYAEGVAGVGKAYRAGTPSPSAPTSASSAPNAATKNSPC